MKDDPKREISDWELKQRLAGAYEGEAQNKTLGMSSATGHHDTAGCAAAPGDPIGSADEEARHLLRKLINVKMTHLDYAQREVAEAHYLRALFDSLPTKMSHDAAMGLKLLVRSYGNTPTR